MNREKFNLIMVLTLIMALSTFNNAIASDIVEWNVYKTLQLDASPIDVALTLDGRKIFILTDQGEVLIFSSSDKPEAKIEVGKHVDRIKLGPRGDTLILSSGKNKTVQVVSLDFVQKINTFGAPYKGPSDGSVVIAVFDDFQWKYCAKLVPVLEQVLEKYPKDVKVVFKNFPLQNHKFALKAAVAALAAERQGKFWEFHDLLFKNYNQLNDDKIQEIAKAVGLNLEEYEKMKKDPAIERKVRQDLSDGRRAGVRGTPTVFINGRRLRDRSLKGFQAVIDKELERLGKTAAKPTS